MHILVKTMIKLLSFINWSMFRTVSHQFSDTMMVLVAASKVSKNWKSIDWNVSVLVSCYLGPFPTTRARPTTPPVTGALNLPWTTQNLCSWLFIFPPGHSGWMYTKAGLPPPPTLPTHPQLYLLYSAFQQQIILHLRYFKVEFFVQIFRIVCAEIASLRLTSLFETQIEFWHFHR